eukprot:SAG31_NODE_440_length_15664_cov_8.209252_11_plen_108_part_00
MAALGRESAALMLELCTSKWLAKTLLLLSAICASTRLSLSCCTLCAMHVCDGGVGATDGQGSVIGKHQPRCTDALTCAAISFPFCVSVCLCVCVSVCFLIADTLCVL